MEKKFLEYLSYRIDIIANDPNRWLGDKTKFQLPTFEYYLNNCVNDKNGKYDFTKQSYFTPMQVLKPISFKTQSSIQMQSKTLNRFIKHSYWMGTPFNYSEIITFR